MSSPNGQGWVRVNVGPAPTSTWPTETIVQPAEPRSPTRAANEKGRVLYQDPPLDTQSLQLYCSLKVTRIRAGDGTGLPFTVFGWNFHSGKAFCADDAKP